ncbi:MAG: CPCC family cysteine-rich protein [Pelagimonas sp.]|uniref:CPCC family cysteine-rich protein n=1 Tax=Pelagimonas sp. TaxID=2073170 RepID=UPI003D6B4CCD
MCEFSCPCCGFPTLTELGGYEICPVCWWEDDGQDGHSAEVVHGGPNGRYSLSDARKNFNSHGYMYDLGSGLRAVEQPSPARVALMAYVFEVRDGGEFNQDVLDVLIKACQ